MHEIIGYLRRFASAIIWKMPAISIFTSFGNNDFLMWGKSIYPHHFSLQVAEQMIAYAS